MDSTHYLGALFLSVMLFSCSREASLRDISNVGDAVVFSGVSTQTKVQIDRTDDGRIGAFWEKGDRVGIYASTAGFVLGENVPYQVSVSPEFASRCALEPLDEAIVWSGEDVHSFRAYAPYTSAASDISRIPFNLPSEQHQNSLSDISGLSEYVLLCSDMVSSVPGGSDIGDDADVSFRFTPFFPVIEVDVSTIPEAVGSSLVKASLTSEDMALAAACGYLDLSDVTPEISYEDVASRIVSVDFERPQILSTEKGTVFFVVAPGDYGSLLLTLYFKDGSCVTKEISVGKLENSSHYVCELTIGSAETEKWSGVKMPCCISFASVDGIPVFGVCRGNMYVCDGGMKMYREESRSIGTDGTEYDSNIVITSPSQVSSASWSELSAYTFDIPMAEELFGTLRMDFKFMGRGWAEWVAEWSADGCKWYGGTNGRFSHYNSTQVSTYCKYFEIPHTCSIPAGGHFYVRLRPFNRTACSGGEIRETGPSADPALLHAVIFTRCSIPSAGIAPSDAIFYEDFSDCLEGVDVIGLGIGKVLGCCNIDGPLYGTYTNIWQRFGYVRLGNPGQKSSYYSEPLTSLDGVEKTALEVGLRLAAYRGPDGVCDSGDIVVSLCNGRQRTGQQMIVPSSRLKADAWTEITCRFENATNMSTVEVSATSTRFYMDDVIIRRAE